jgi:hypothetical protein
MPQYNQAEAVEQQLAAMEAERQKAISASQLPKAMNGGFLMPGSNQVLPNLPGLVPELAKDPVAQKKRQGNLDTLYKQSPMYKQETGRRKAGSNYNVSMRAVGGTPAGQAVLGMGPNGIPLGWQDKQLVNTGEGYVWMTDKELGEWGKTLRSEENPKGKTIDMLMSESSSLDKPFSVLRLNRRQISPMLDNRQSLQDLLAAPDVKYDNWRNKIDWDQHSGFLDHQVQGGDPNFPGYRWNPRARDRRI